MRPRSAVTSRCWLIDATFAGPSRPGCAVLEAALVYAIRHLCPARAVARAVCLEVCHCSTRSRLLLVYSCRRRSSEVEPTGGPFCPSCRPLRFTSWLRARLVAGRARHETKGQEGDAVAFDSVAKRQRMPSCELDRRRARGSSMEAAKRGAVLVLQSRKGCDVECAGLLASPRR